MNKKTKKTFKFILILGLIISIYSSIIEPSLLIVKKIILDKNGNKVEIEKENKDSLKVVQITDTQIGLFYPEKKLRKLVSKINSLEPDIVVFTGDLIDYATKNPDIEEIINNLSKIDTKIGKFAVFGNHDYMYELPKYYRRIMKESGFKLLVNENRRIDVGNNKYINIIGLDEKLHGKPDINKCKETINPNDFNLLLLHEPDVIDKFNGNKIDLALAGHTHGGQVSMPIKGAILKVPYGKKYTKGFYNINKTNLYVSSGLGSTKLPFRLLNIPEIVEFNIEL